MIRYFNDIGFIAYLRVSTLMINALLRLKAYSVIVKKYDFIEYPICDLCYRNLPLLGRVWNWDMSKNGLWGVFWPFSDFGILWLPEPSWTWSWSFKSKFDLEKIFFWIFWSNVIFQFCILSSFDVQNANIIPSIKYKKYVTTI